MSALPPRNPLLRCVACAAEPFYAGALGLRNILFDQGLRKTHRAHVPVISVGNLTAGGTGKTPTVAAIVRRLIDHAFMPAVVMRGYRAESTGGSDEQRELEQMLPGVPIIANPDRVAAAASIARDHPDVNVIVLDDGFQHRRIARDLDLVLIDATDPFGADHVLPAGLMRERPGNLRRADAVVVTRSDSVDKAALADIDARIARYHGSSPIAHAIHGWIRIVDATDTPIDRPGAHVHTLSGIGNPAAFIDQAGKTFRVVGSTVRPDHTAYTEDDLLHVVHEARDNGADALLTTPKDWVKLHPLVESTATDMPVWRPVVELGFVDGEGMLTKLLIERTRRISDCQLPIAD